MVDRALQHWDRTADAGMARIALRVKGVVQGVGFRPFVHRLATTYGLGGFVRNDTAGVSIEVEGPPASLANFQASLEEFAPPAARIEQIATLDLRPVGETTFTIVASGHEARAHTQVAPDIAICDDCLRELFDPVDPRYRYPFINCTNCGPRYTILRGLPYDRPLTTMAGFELCPLCRRQYEDPLDRRFHAQPIACPTCGPKLAFEYLHAPQSLLTPVGGDGTTPAYGEDALSLTIQAISRGQIAAIKGIGGFHLACDATNDEAVARLRDAKQRGDKPYAIMARDLQSVLQVAHADADEIAMLTGPAHPIVLLKRKADTCLSAYIAPGNPLIGVMLPYTPLHHLLFAPVPDTGQQCSPWLVMTSANHPGEPIIFDDDQARTQLIDLADVLLSHNRPIIAPCDDSVMRVVESVPLPVRRARGYAPLPIRLPACVPPTLAVGGELKNTLCVAADDHAFLSQHIGDMATLETQLTFAATAGRLQTLFNLDPTVVACDLHPAYHSTRWAKQWAQEHADARLVGVQHHHAHIAALMAEHRLSGERPIIGVCFDGTGYGPDGAIWGGEVLIADYSRFTRAAHLAYLPLPGGDAAVEKPYRMALAALWSAGIPWDTDLPPVSRAGTTELAILQQQLTTGLNCVATSSMGRLFDVVATLCDVCHVVTYEAQAAIELEALTCHEPAAYDIAIMAGEVATFDVHALLRAIVRDLRSGIAPARVATRFHRTIAQWVLWQCQAIRAQTGLNVVGLTGGVFQNQLLLQFTMQALAAAAFEVLLHRQVPPNDGGLALGQVMVAAHQGG